jgi:hypothetical protein
MFSGYDLKDIASALDKLAGAAVTAANAYADKCKQPNVVVNVNKEAAQGSPLSTEIANQVVAALKNIERQRPQDRR